MLFIFSVMHMHSMEATDCGKDHVIDNDNSLDSIASRQENTDEKIDSDNDVKELSMEEKSEKESPKDSDCLTPESTSSPSSLIVSNADKTKAIKRQVEAPPATRQTMGTQQAQSKEANGDTKSRNLNLISCEDCGLVCAGQSHYQVHVRSHTGERPFKCTICGVAFTQKGNLRRHYKIHSEEKPFQCPVCSYRCRRRDALNGHMRIHSDIRPYRCVYCARSYKSRQSLKEHEYQCTYKNDPIARASPPKLSAIDQHSSKSSPKNTNCSPTPQSQTNLPLSNSSQSLLNFSTTSLSAVSAAFAGSSGKRKASNPQKFTRSREVPGSLSPSLHMSANVGASVASALQFMPSVISSMMQQHMADDPKSESPSSPQVEAIDFSSKRLSPKQSLNNRSGNDSDAIDQTSAYSNSCPRIGGEFFLTSSSLLNGEIKREFSGSSFRKLEERGQLSNHDDQIARMSPSRRNESNLSTHLMEKLTGSARRKRPRYMNERISDYQKTPPIKRQSPLNHSSMDFSGRNSFLRSSVVGNILSSDSKSSSIIEKLQSNSFGKTSDVDISAATHAKSGDASRVGLRVFMNQHGEGSDDMEELPAYVCVHCCCIFLDHVMFSIHAGCHGYRDPFECTVCGHIAADRYQFISHLTRGEHVLAVSNEKTIFPKDGEEIRGSHFFNKHLESTSSSFSSHKGPEKARHQINEVPLL